MTIIKKIAFIIVLIIFALPRDSLGENLDFEIGANANDLKLRLGWEFPHHISNPEVGVGLIYGDDYLISDLSLAVKDKAFIRELTLGLGFKGVLGEVESHNKDFNLRAISFLVLGEYAFRKKFFEFPMNASVHISVAPGPLNTSDSDRYLEFSSAFHLKIVKNAAIGVEYRAFEARFDDISGKVKKSDDAIFFGFKLEF